MSFPKFHGITLAANAWIENAVVERLSADPTPITASRIWYNTSTKQLKFSSLNGGGAVIVEVVATGANVSDALTQLAALGARVDAIEADYVKKDGSVAFTGDINAGNNKVVNVAAGVAATDAVNLAQVDAKIAALGNAFDYVGTVDGGASSGAAFDMNTLSATTSGKYYKVTTAGYFKVGAAGTPFYANLNDGLVFNTTAGVDKIDNTDSTVTGTAGFISVSGTTDTGFVVDIDSAFKTRMSDAESAITAEVARATAAEGTLTTNLSAEVTRATGAEAAIAADLSTEVSRAQAAESGLQGAINTEAAARAAADGTLTTNLSNEVTRAQAAEAAIASDLSAEVSRATAAEGTLTTNLAAEVTRATAAESTLTSNLSAEVTRATAAEGVLTSDLASEVTRAQAAEGVLTTNLANEVTARSSADTTLQANIDAEAAARAAADSTLTTNLSAEVTRATAAEGTLTTNLAAEVTRATGAETTLQTNITAVDTKVGSLASLTTTDQTDIVSAINEVKLAAGGGTEALRGAINAQRYTFASGAPALVHVVSHMLNTGFAAVQTWVKGDDNVYRNDIVAVEETDSNTITVTLTESRNIKVTVQAMDAVTMPT